MLITCLPSNIFDTIVSLLNRRERRMLISSSKEWSGASTFRVRYPLRDLARTLGMFQRVDSVLPGDALVRKVAKIAADPDRSIALVNWIANQRVGIDPGGFFTPNDVQYHNTDTSRIRIKLWDRPLGFRRDYYHHGTDYGVDMVPFLRHGFVRMGYNP